MLGETVLMMKPPPNPQCVDTPVRDVGRGAEVEGVGASPNTFLWWFIPVPTKARIGPPSASQNETPAIAGFLAAIERTIC